MFVRECVHLGRQFFLLTQAIAVKLIQWYFRQYIAEKFIDGKLEPSPKKLQYSPVRFILHTRAKHICDSVEIRKPFSDIDNGTQRGKAKRRRARKIENQQMIQKIKGRHRATLRIYVSAFQLRDLVKHLIKNQKFPQDSRNLHLESRVRYKKAVILKSHETLFCF